MKDFVKKVKEDPFAKLLNIEIDSIDKGFARCSVAIQKDMVNFLGLPHGGLIFSLADVAFSAASNSDHLPSYALDISGSFLKAVNIGDTVIAEASLIHTTKRTGVYKIEVKHKNDLVAIFNGTVFRKI